MATLPVWPKPGLNVQKENAPPGIHYTPAEVVERTTYVQRRLDQSDLFDYDPTGVPYYPFIDAQSIVQGRVGTDLDTLRGLYDGATTLTTGRNSEGDGNGANFTWDETSVVARNGTTVFGLGATGRWLQTGTVGGGGGASFTGPSISFTANGTLNTTGIADAAFFAVVPTSDNLIARGLTPPSSGSNINVRKAFNNSNYTIVIPHEDTGASATARFATDDGVSKIWPGKTWMDFSHDATLTRYRVRAQDDALVNGLLVTDLATTRGRREGESRFTLGLAAAGDRGGGWWFWDGDPAASGSHTWQKRVVTGVGYWRRDLADGRINIAWLGCKDDGSVDCAAPMLAVVAEKVAEFAGAGGVVHFYAPACRKTLLGAPGYYRLDDEVLAPADVHVRVVVEGDGSDLDNASPFGRNDLWLGAGQRAHGTIFRQTALNKCAFGGAANGYSAIDLRRVGLVGPGRGTAPAVRTQIGTGNVQVFTDDVMTGNWFVGFDSSEVSGKKHFAARAFGCFHGVRMRGTDSAFDGARFEGCNNGVFIDIGYGHGFWNTTIQGCAVGARIGNTSGPGYGATAFIKCHFEVNGPNSGSFIRNDCVTATTTNDSLSGLAARNGVTPTGGQRVLVTGQTSPAQNGPYVAAAGAWARADTSVETHAGCIYEVTGGSQVGWWQIDNSTPAFLDDADDLVIVKMDWHPLHVGYAEWDIQHIIGGASNGLVTTEKCIFASTNLINAQNFVPIGNYDFRLNVDTAKTCDASLAGQPSPSTPWTIALVSFYTPPHFFIHGAVLAGAYSADWAQYGSDIKATLAADSTFGVPTNARDGAELTVTFQQDVTGGRRLTLNSGIVGYQEWSNLGNLASRLSSITLKLAHGTWKVHVKQTPYWVNNPVVTLTASTTQTQGQQPIHAPVARVTTVANANDVVTLPLALDLVGLGTSGLVVTNEGANTLQIFPALGDDVGGGANVSTTLAAGASARFIALSSTRLLKL